LLERPEAQRLQEFRYRFGQSAVFGLPVVALQWFGRSLGGTESDLWVTLFQALLAGWVVYVAATGMLAEAALLLLTRRRPPAAGLAYALVAAAAVTGYLLSLPRLVLLMAHRGTAGTPWPSVLHWVVIMLAVWTGMRWRRLAARAKEVPAAPSAAP
jgi:hypothetical protein